MFDHKFSENYFGLEIRIDYLLGLGVRNYPTLLLADLPNVFARVLPGGFKDWIFASVSAAALFFAVSSLVFTLTDKWFLSELTGIVSVFAVIEPTPVKWTQVPLYTSSAVWTLALLMFSVTLQLKAGQRPTGSRRQVVSLLLAGLFSYLSAAVGLVGAPILFVAHLVIAISLILSGRFLTSQNMLSRLTVALSPVFGVAIALASAIPVITSTAGGSGSPKVSSIHLLEQNLGRIWFFNELAHSPIPGYRWMVMLTLLAGIVSFLRIRELRLLTLATAPIVLAIVYGALSTAVLATIKKEWLFSPRYLALYVTPFMALLVANGIAEAGSRIILLVRMFGHSPSRIEKLMTVALWIALPVWSLVWSVDNRHLQSPEWRYPRPTSDLVGLVSDLRWDVGEEFRGRVLVTQSPKESQDDLGNTILFPSVEMKRLSRDLYIERIPNMTAYTHLLSVPFVEFVSARLTDGRPLSRTWIVPNKIDVNVLSALRVRYVLSVGELFNPKLIQVASEVDSTTGRSIFLYQVSSLPQDGTLEPLEELIDGPRVMLRADGLEIEIADVTGEFLVLPFEMDRCLTLTSDSGSARLEVSDGLLVGIRTNVAEKMQIRFKKRLFGLIPCS
jgi:hypothetical protein